MPKLSIFSWYSYPLPLEERLRLIKQAGFDATILWWEDDSDDSKHGQPEMVRKIGLEIDNIHAPFQNANQLWQDSLNSADYLTMLLGCVDDCALHDIPTVVIHMASFTEMPLVTSIGLKRINQLVDRAELKEVNLAFENLKFFPPLAYVFENAQSKRLGFCFDSGHQHCSHPEVDYLGRYGDKLFAVHLADNFGHADTHLLPYDGTVNWGKLKTRLKTCRPLDYLSLEVGFHPDHAESKIYQHLSAGEYLALAMERLQRICAPDADLLVGQA